MIIVESNELLLCFEQQMVARKKISFTASFFSKLIIT